MATSPLSAIQDPSVRFTIKVDGSAIKDTYGVTSIEVHHAVNRISTAELVLQGEVDLSSDSFLISDGDDFKPGKKIEISVGYGDSAQSIIFTGNIVRHSVDIDIKTGRNLRLYCKHGAVTMTYNRKDAVFVQKQDSAIIQSIVGTYSGLSVTVDSTTQQHPFVYQRMATDWDFILSRAEFCGYIVTLDGDSIKIGKPEFTGSAVLRLAVGDSLISFSADISAENQPTTIEAHAWDQKTQTLLSSTAAEPSLNSQGDLTPKTMSSMLSQTALKLNSPVPLSTDELKTWAEGILLRKRLSALRGTAKFVGSALAKTGTLAELAGVGAKFNGNAFISSVKHNITGEDGWNTTIKFGLDAGLISQKQDFSFEEAGGQLPAIHGIQIGTVKKLSSDPDGANRIQVTLPSPSDTSADVWARYTNFYATNTAGSGFMPEIGDEVAVAFFDGDPRFPLILGSLYGSKNASPNTPSDDNNYIKSIVTKAKLKLTMDDEKKAIIIETPGGNKITFSDDSKSIELADQNSNSIKMSSSGIELKSAKDIKLTATGGITLDATAKVTIGAKQDVAITGLNVNATANVGFTAKGSATAEVSASGQTTIKGGIVMIN